MDSSEQKTEQNEQVSIADNNPVIDDSMNIYMKTISEAVEDRMNEIKAQLDEKKSEMIEAIKFELLDVDKIGSEMKELQTKVFSGEKKDNYKNEVKHLKDLVDVYIQRCEDLESYGKSIKEVQLSDLLAINKNQIHLKPNVLKFLKRVSKGITADLKWSNTQKKLTYTLIEDGTKMIVNYSSCWNDFYSENVFTKGVVEIHLEVNSMNTTTFHSIGVTNESYNGVSNCLGCQGGANAYIVKLDGTININGVTSTSMITFPSNTITTLIITLNLNEKTITFARKGGPIAGPFSITGQRFRVTTAACSGGTVHYKFLPDSIITD